MVKLPFIICFLKTLIVYLCGTITNTKVENFSEKKNNRLIINIFDDILPGYITLLNSNKGRDYTGKTGKSSVNIPWRDSIERKE